MKNQKLRQEQRQHSSRASKSSEEQFPMPSEEVTTTMPFILSEDSWADCLSVQSEEAQELGLLDSEALELDTLELDTLELDLDGGGGFNWESNKALDQDTGAVETLGQETDETTLVAQEGLLDETIPMGLETGTPQSIPVTSGPPVPASIAAPEIDAIHDAGLPVFTPEEVTSELATLTAPEMENAVNDLYGITAGLTNLQIRPPRPAVLFSMENEICKLPAEQTAAYRQALLKCPGLLNDKRKMAFLNRDDGDPALAAARLATYWELRLELFGPDRCFLPMTLNGAMKGETENMVRWPIHQILPVKDASGRGIWYFDVSLRDFDNYSVEQECMALWYMLEAAAEDPEVIKHGLVVLSSAKHVEIRHFRPPKKGNKPSKPPAGRIVSIFQAMPYLSRASHFCHPNVLLYYLLPVFMYAFGRNGRLRLQLHRGSDAEILQELAKFGLTRGCVPTDLAGDVVLDMAKFLAYRLVLESSRPDPRIVVDAKPIAVPKGPTTKRLRVVTDSPVETDPSIMKGKTRGITDPRMTSAVKIRLDNPKMPLKEVLFKAGFRFDLKNEKGQDVDSEYTTMAQRKNNLCRRVRQEKAKRKEEGVNPCEEVQQVNEPGSTPVETTTQEKERREEEGVNPCEEDQRVNDRGSTPVETTTQEKARGEEEGVNPCEEAQRVNERGSTPVETTVPGTILMVGDGLLGTTMNASGRSIPFCTIDSLEGDPDESDSICSSEEIQDSLHDHAINTLKMDPDESGSKCSSSGESRDSFYDAILELSCHEQSPPCGSVNGQVS